MDIKTHIKNAITKDNKKIIDLTELPESKILVATFSLNELNASEAAAWLNEIYKITNRTIVLVPDDIAVGEMGIDDAIKWFKNATETLEEQKEMLN